MKSDFGKIRWNLLVESAKQWIEDECLGMEGNGDGDREARRIRANLQLFVKHMPEFWIGAGVDARTLMVEYARLENLEAVRVGLMETIDEAHFCSNGVAFRSRHLQEPNVDIRPHQE